MPTRQALPRAQRTVALDLGVVCGLAAGTPGAMLSRSINLAPRAKTEMRGNRKLFAVLDALALHFPPDVVAIRKPEGRAAKGVRKEQSALIRDVLDWVKDCGAEARLYPAPDIRKGFTCNGNASADLMDREARRRGFSPSHAKETNAIALLDLVLAG